MTQTVVGKPEKRGAGWFVPSGTTGVGYYVEITRDTVRCTCPSFIWRRTRLPGRECKHIKVVREVMRMERR